GGARAVGGAPGGTGGGRSAPAGVWAGAPEPWTVTPPGNDMASVPASIPVSVTTGPPAPDENMAPPRTVMWGPMWNTCPPNAPKLGRTLPLYGCPSNRTVPVPSSVDES